REELEHFIFPDNNHVEKNNSRCFTDFLTYLKNCEETNLTRSKQEIIPLEFGLEETYRYENNISEPEITPLKIKSSYVAETDYKQEVTKKIMEYLTAFETNTEASPEDTLKKFFAKIDE